MSNRLAQETSPYLRQHADNPVHWYPWGQEALERAKVEDKPIFLSIGYSACHWCHVMAHESFEDTSDDYRGNSESLHTLVPHPHLCEAYLFHQLGKGAVNRLTPQSPH